MPFASRCGQAPSKGFGTTCQEKTSRRSATFTGLDRAKAFWHPPRDTESALVSYRERVEKKQEEVKGHNHPAYEKCGPHCPRNVNYKGPEKKGNPFSRNRR